MSWSCAVPSLGKVLFWNSSQLLQVGPIVLQTTLFMATYDVIPNLNDTNGVGSEYSMTDGNSVTLAPSQAVDSNGNESAYSNQDSITS